MNSRPLTVVRDQQSVTGCKPLGQLRRFNETGSLR
jgi:hypothetical protein